MTFSVVAYNWYLPSIFSTNQVKALTLEGTLDFHKKFVGWKGTESGKLLGEEFFFLLKIL